jgi:hypothetical protein
MKRFVLEGEWSGYRSAQQCVVHRTAHKGSEKTLRAWAERIHAIQFTDGTALRLSVRDAAPGERITAIHGYDSLIRDCMYRNVQSVAELQALVSR